MMAVVIPMKDADFQSLLQGIREAGSYLRGNKKAAARIDHIAPESVVAIRAKSPGRAVASRRP